MTAKKHNAANRLLSVLLAVVLSATMMTGFAKEVRADSATATYDAPTEPMEVDPNIITGTAHRAASPALDMMGLNAVSGFGMINGSAPTDLESASKAAAVGIWGTSINDNPDPYFWNYFYNFYVDANPDLGLVKSTDALMNPGVSASPMQADGTLVEEYGNVSVSLSTRPEVVIGTAARGAAESDTSGYDAQIATINSFTPESEFYHEGDETYAPALVPYTRATLVDMISSVRNIGYAMDDITDATGKVGRYADENGYSSYIADEYENFIYGLQAYILSRIDQKKTVAIITAVSDDKQTFTIADASTQEATSSNRYVEYTDIVGENIAATLGTTTVTAEQLAAADVLILSNFNSEGFTDASGQAVTFYELLKDQETYNENQIIIENYPSALYGITMNSVENAMGMAYITSYMYSDNANVGLDPVSMCAYYYQKFYHISDIENLKEAIAINFANVTLPAGMAGTLSDSYSAADIDWAIALGKHYYQENQEAFADTYIGKAAWAAVDTLGHELVYVDPVAKTCEEDGTLGYYYCADCGKKFSDETAAAIVTDEELVDKATGHEYSVVVTKATTTTSGKAEKKCSICGNVAAKTTLYKASSIKLSAKSFTYNGSVQKPEVIVNDCKGNALNPNYYTISYSKSSSKAVGTYTVTVKLKGRYTGSKELTYKIVKAANPLTVKTKNATVKYSDLSKKNQTIAKAAVFTVSKNKGTVTYKKTSGDSKITVASNGKITVKKGLAKGTYTVKVQVKAAGNSGYKAGTKTVSFKITVK